MYKRQDEQVIVQEVTGRSVPERGLPLDVGCVVDNVGTVLSIADALERKPVSEKYLSVTGAVSHTGMYHVPLGTPITPVSYTHLDVYKRQAVYRDSALRRSRTYLLHAYQR